MRSPEWTILTLVGSVAYAAEPYDVIVERLEDADSDGWFEFVGRYVAREGDEPIETAQRVRTAMVVGLMRIPAGAWEVPDE